MESRARPPWMAEAQEQSSGRRFLLAVLVSTLWIGPTQPMHAAEPELRVIALKHRLANEVVPVVRPLLAPGESVNGMDSRLIVRASSRTFAQIEQVLAEIDKARRNLRIQVRHAGESGRLRESQGVTGDVRRGNTRIVNEASFTNNANSGTGVTIAGTGPGGVVQLHSERRIISARATTQPRTSRCWTAGAPICASANPLVNEASFTCNHSWYWSAVVWA